MRGTVMILQNIPTMAELLGRENTSLVVLLLRKCTARLVFYDSAVADRCCTLLSDVNEPPAGGADH